MNIHLRKFSNKLIMETKILKVVRQGEAFSVQSSKQESGVIQKCNIVLKELGLTFAEKLSSKDE